MELCVQTKTGIQCITGYKLKNDLACHHALSSKQTGWVVVDMASGLMIKNNFATLKACMDYAAECPELEKITKARKSPKYQKAIDVIETWKKAEKK